MKRSFEGDSAHSHKKHKNNYERSSREKPIVHNHLESRNADNSKHEGRNYDFEKHESLEGGNSDRQSHGKQKQHGYPESRKQKESSGHKKKDSDNSSSKPPYRLPSPTTPLATVTPFTPYTVLSTLPPLPPLPPGDLSLAPFKHKSTTTYSRTATATRASDLTYERLEFLGDAYIELIASRLIFAHFPHLPVGAQSQLRELLVKNETLAEYSRAYGFEDKIDVQAVTALMEASKKSGKGNKGFNKVLGDVFEAYLAAVILGDVDDGFATAEKWLTCLWAPKLEAAAKDVGNRAYNPSLQLSHPDYANPLETYNPTAKQELQQRVMRDASVKLSYEPYQKSVELKGDLKGQNRHFIAVHLTGWGFERVELGRGEGKNKVEAGNWAAVQAMHGKGKGVVEACVEMWRKDREAGKGGGRKKSELVTREGNGEAAKADGAGAVGTGDGKDDGL